MTIKTIFSNLICTLRLSVDLIKYSSHKSISWVWTKKSDWTRKCGIVYQGTRLLNLALLSEMRSVRYIGQVVLRVQHFKGVTFITKEPKEINDSPTTQFSIVHVCDKTNHSGFPVRVPNEPPIFVQSKYDAIVGMFYFQFSFQFNCPATVPCSIGKWK